MNQELARHQQMYRELVSTGQTSSPAAEVIQKKMESLMTRYLSLKAALLVPSTLENSFLFGSLTGSWMVQLAFHTGMIYFRSELHSEPENLKKSRQKIS